jgi:hypothetical protein
MGSFVESLAPLSARLRGLALIALPILLAACGGGSGGASSY